MSLNALDWHEGDLRKWSIVDFAIKQELLKLAETLKPKPECPFCEEDAVCGTCYTLATVQGTILAIAEPKVPHATTLDR
jgi:hypothetical protein